MKSDTKTNKLSIYLIKEEYSDIDAILKNAAGLESQSIDGVGTLYFGKSHPYQPSWVKSFFAAVDFDLPMLNSTSKAILLAPVKIKKGKERMFAIPFGYGWSLMNEGVGEERFGLKVTLNTVDRPV
jgi:uncharacterized protein (TIGR04141 family)